MAEKNFPFVILDGPKVKDPQVRRMIRKQAMKDVGEARKQRGNYGRVNMRQVPVFNESIVPNGRAVHSDSSGEDTPSSDHSSGQSYDASSTEATDYDEEVDRVGALQGKAVPVMALQNGTGFSLAAINLFSTYETARAKFHIDVTDLSILTNFNVGKTAMPILSADPSRLAALLGQQEWSYLEYVPSLYGSSEVVAAATNCLMAQAKITLSPHDHCEKVALQLYAKALRALQAAITSETSCISSDVLCATQLLSLHELLDATRDNAWSHHISGAARIVKHRTSTRFNTEFDKALFAAHVGAMVSECLYQDVACYLEEDEWMSLYKSLTKDTDFLHNRSSLTINIRSAMFALPGLWHDIGDVITGPGLFDDRELVVLEDRCRREHRGYVDWMEDYKAHCVRLSLATPPPTEIAMRREIFGAGLECLILVKRFLATVCDRDRVALEIETQALAHLILDLQKQPSSANSWLFSGHEVGVAYTVMLTKDQWEDNFSYMSDTERRLAVRTRYNTWSNTLRMTG